MAERAEERVSENRIGPQRDNEHIAKAQQETGQQDNMTHVRARGLFRSSRRWGRSRTSLKHRVAHHHGGPLP